MTSADRIGQAELHAFVDGQLDAAGRLDVQDHLARHPDLAAQVMADLRTRDALRLAFPDTGMPGRLEILAAARRLERGLKLRRLRVPLTRMAAAAAIFAIGWGAGLSWTDISRPPASPSETALLVKAERLGKALDVHLPRIPPGWTMTGASVVRSEGVPGAPAVQLTFQTPEFGRLSLIAHSTTDIGIVLPTITEGEGESASTASWQLVSDSYALTADLPRKPLEFAALELFQTLY